MWRPFRQFRPIRQFTGTNLLQRNGFHLRFRAYNAGSGSGSGAGAGTSALALGTALVLGTYISTLGSPSSSLANDTSANSLGGVDVDSSIDPFPVAYPKAHLGLFSSDHVLVASGVRSVTFLGFKVYGVGLYIPKKDEGVVRAVVEKYAKENPQMDKEALLNDKEVSQRIISDISKRVPYAVKITPVRNTDFGHLKDGLTKSILANPMAKEHRDEVAQGVSQLRDVFAGHKGSVPKNDTLWVVSDTSSTSIVYEGKKSTKSLGTVSEPRIAELLLVSYLSSVKPLSEPLRKSFVSYIV